MQVSQRGLDLIAKFEGVVLHAYNDPVGHCTVGVGHLIHRGNCTQEDYTRWRNMTRAQAMRLLKLDLASREAAVDRLVTVPLNQNEFDALVSFVFNLGVGAFEKSTLLRLLNQGKRKAAAEEFGRWVFAGGQKLPGLVTRRAAERRLFQTPVVKETAVTRPKGAPADLPEKWFDHWRRPWLPKARRNIAFRHWLGRHGYLTPHFTKREAASKDGVAIPKHLRPAARNHAFKLERIRHELGNKPIPIVSWYRSPARNVAVGGAKFSKHLAAIATDHPKAWVDANGGQDRILKLADSVNINGFGRYPGGNVHMDSRWGPLTIWSSW